MNFKSVKEEILPSLAEFAKEKKECEDGIMLERGFFTHVLESIKDKVEVFISSNVILVFYMEY